MSDSRLEKFIYAICSMDVSDLPVPLSRIEKLWNCLITGETPDFEPLSRNEKYLMAMLDRYDISNLPAPMSRGEKLLYKIAVSETDLSDVPGYLSRYEELLKYLIENGGISEGDFEYVLYTLNQSMYTLYTTAEKPVKSAILTGQTLVNCLKPQSGDYSEYQITSTYKDFTLFKPNTLYTFINNWDKGGTLAIASNTGQITNVNFAKNSSTLFTTPSAIANVEIYSVNGIYGGTPSDCEKWKTAFIVIEGDYTNEDIPYFEGMQSVKMPVLTTVGKNLFDGVSYIDGFVATGNNYTVSYDTNVVSILANVNKNTDYILSAKTTFDRSLVGGSLEPISIGTKTTNLNAERVSNTVKFNSGEFTNIIIYLNSSKIDIEDIQVEEGTVATTYEPYKSNILTTSEEVTLRGIGEVKDELDLLTGELTQRVEEIVLDGSENWNEYTLYGIDGYTAFITTIPSLNNLYHGTDKIFISADFPVGTWEDYRTNLIPELVWNHDPNKIGIRVKNEKASNVEKIKEFLSTNNIRINYKLATESIKTVDLTVVDQDNQPTQLGTFENITHVSLEAENLIPEVEMEVATHISEELASASPLMDDISTEQQQLETTVDEQSNNVDATMIATTEIYEETL